MGEFRNEINHISKYIKRTSRTLRWIWIISLFLSPFIGLFNMVILLYIAIYQDIDWNVLI
jgi:hypothetical protein